MSKIKIIRRFQKEENEFNTKKKIKLKFVKKQKDNEDDNKEKIITPSDLHLPVFVMTPPLHAEFVINNEWMEELAKEGKVEINIGRMVYEWHCLYQCLTQEGIVLTYPTVPKLADLHYINCYDEKTEILTDEGWKYFKDLTGKEKVATLNSETGELIYQKPIDYQKFYYKGKMFHIKSQLVDLCVTPNHRMYISRNSKRTFRFCTMEECKNSYMRLLLAPKFFKGKREEKFILPKSDKRTWKYTNNLEKIDIILWLKFLGWFLSEGHIDNYAYNKYGRYRIVLSQHKEKNKQEIREILQKLGVSFTETENQFIISSNKHLFDYLSIFGKSEDRFIPREIKELPSDLLKILLETLVKGDGTFAGTTWVYSSKSKQLVDDVQEIAIKCGYRAKVERTSWNENLYQVVINVNKNYSAVDKQNIKEIDYEGYVYDVTVPKYHILLVRRNGCACFSGNSFVYLPHILDKRVCIISRFRAKGRDKEEAVAFDFLTKCGYECHQPPAGFYFEGEPECFDEETEILTDEGWKYFKDLNGNEKVMTYNPETNTLYWQKPVRYIKVKYKGKMFHFKNRYLDILVSPNHFSYYRVPSSKEYMLKRTKEMPTNFYIKVTGIFKGDYPDYVEIKCPDGKILKFKSKLWMKFLGWYLSEGYSRVNIDKSIYKIEISQDPKVNYDKYEEIYLLLKEMGFNVWKCKHSLTFHNKSLALYLNSLGKTKQKYIPKEFKELHPDLLKLLIDSLIKGDGTKSRTTKYVTASKQLADDFQEIAAKCGYRTVLSKERKGNFEWYTIYLTKRNEVCFHSKCSIIEEIDYDGYIYDVEVPENHILLVRRKGKPFLSGNCRYIRDNYYVGGYGERSTREALEWIEQNFDCRIFKIGQTSGKLFHTDCLAFPITPWDVLVATKHIADKDELKELEKVVNVIPIEDENLLEFGIMNSIVVGYTVYTADLSESFSRNSEEYKIERKKRETLCKIANDLGLEVIFIPFDEFTLQGALLSCCLSRLNWIDRFLQVAWKEGANSIAFAQINRKVASIMIEDLEKNSYL